MKLQRQQIELLAGSVVRKLTERDVATIAAEPETMLLIENLITDDLQVEDRLNEEVRTILSEHESQMRTQGVQYHDMFKIVKQKLVRERKLIL